MKDQTLVIDAQGLILGRLCSYVAKKLLLGYSVSIVNVEKAIVTGNRAVVLAKFKRFTDMGEPTHGPFIEKSARGLFKRSLKRMLPHKKARGIEALRRLKVYKGFPLRFSDQKMESLEEAHVSKVPNTKYLYLGEVSSFIGGR